LGIGQVLNPNKVYAPQKLNKPVANTTMPTQPQGPNWPVAAKAINASPATIRKMRSIPPTFLSMNILQSIELIHCAPNAKKVNGFSIESRSTLT
jgi:hypothetical protein